MKPKKSTRPPIPATQRHSEKTTFRAFMCVRNFPSAREALTEFFLLDPQQADTLLHAASIHGHELIFELPSRKNQLFGVIRHPKGKEWTAIASLGDAVFNTSEKAECYITKFNNKSRLKGLPVPAWLVIRRLEPVSGSRLH